MSLHLGATHCSIHLGALRYSLVFVEITSEESILKLVSSISVGSRSDGSGISVGSGGNSSGIADSSRGGSISNGGSSISSRGSGISNWGSSNGNWGSNGLNMDIRLSGDLNRYMLLVWHSLTAIRLSRDLDINV